MVDTKIQDVFHTSGWFKLPGAYVLVDGQFGSTGKGLLASVIGENFANDIQSVTTNAGPNSGHTGFIEQRAIITQQLPVASAVMAKLGHHDKYCYLNGGAILDIERLRFEMALYLPHSTVLIHPAAAVINEEHKGDQLSRIASTGKGVGPAMADKIMRKDNVFEPYQLSLGQNDPMKVTDWEEIRADQDVVFVETAQGYALGINSGFYPHCTSRECTVAQALADANIAPQLHRKSIATYRTYPIRVGNTPDGYSGPVYADQKELTWEELGQAPELTTVTQRVRRVFTWSWIGYEASLRANRPDAVFVNFCNYMQPGDLEGFLWDVLRVYRETLNKEPDFILTGHGPYNEDVKVWRS